MIVGDYGITEQEGSKTINEFLADNSPELDNQDTQEPVEEPVEVKEEEEVEIVDEVKNVRMPAEDPPQLAACVRTKEVGDSE